MTTMRPACYNRLMNVHEFEDAIAGYAWRYVRTERVNRRLPVLATVWHSLPQPASPEDFLVAYEQTYRDELAGVDEGDWRARVLRAYPSFLREEHLAAVLRATTDWVVVRDIALDYEGVDLLVVPGRLAVAVRTYVDTPLGRASAERKRLARRARIALQFDLPLYLRDARKVGQLLVYPPHQIAALVQEIDRAEHRLDEPTRDN